MVSLVLLVLASSIEVDVERVEGLVERVGYVATLVELGRVLGVLFLLRFGVFGDRGSDIDFLSFEEDRTAADVLETLLAVFFFVEDHEAELSFDAGVAVVDEADFVNASVLGKGFFEVVLSHLLCNPADENLFAGLVDLLVLSRVVAKSVLHTGLYASYLAAMGKSLLLGSQG